MNLIDLAGEYRANVTWSDSFGESGSLSEVMALEPLGGGGVVEGAVVRYEDGSSLRLDPVIGVHGLFTVRRNAEGFAGRAFVTDRSLVLDYVADIQDGLQENITDVWHRHASLITRTGLIRQASRTIWFEAEMSRID